MLLSVEIPPKKNWLPLNDPHRKVISLKSLRTKWLSPQEELSSKSILGFADMKNVENPQQNKLGPYNGSKSFWDFFPFLGGMFSPFFYWADGKLIFILVFVEWNFPVCSTSKRKNLWIPNASIFSTSTTRNFQGFDFHSFSKYTSTTDQNTRPPPKPPHGEEDP